MAFAGWRPASEADDVLLIHDPADNRVVGEGRGEPPHDWRPKALELAVRYGASRPGIVLLPDAAYTVAGAVVVAPAAADSASAMPDLSQEFPGRGPGLCGPTAAADILYAIASGRPKVLDGLGGSPVGNEAAAALVLGDHGLASLMGIGARDDGVTNDGIRAGLEAWLGKADPDAWSVSLDWLEDEPRSPDAQRGFLERLATAVARGGGVVLCLWPGHDSSPSRPAGPPEAAGRAVVKAPATAADPTSASADERPPSETAAATRAVAEARRSLEAARRSVARNRPGEAVEAVGRAVAAVRRPAITDADCRRCLDEALELAAEIDRLAASAVPRATAKPTKFE